MSGFFPGDLIRFRVTLRRRHMHLRNLLGLVIQTQAYDTTLIQLQVLWVEHTRGVWIDTIIGEDQIELVSR